MRFVRNKKHLLSVGFCEREHSPWSWEPRVYRAAIAAASRWGRGEGKSASNQSCESSSAPPDRCGQEPWILVALWGRADVVTAGTFLEHVCPAVGCPCRNSPRPGPGWCRRCIGERRNWLLPLGHTTVQGCWMLPRSSGSHRHKMFCCSLSWHVGSWSHQH